MSGTIEAIYRASAHGEPQAPTDTAMLTAAGLEGDRYAGAGPDGGVVSIIETEAVEQFNGDTGLAIGAAETGRNIATRGVRLNVLVGQRFKLGGAVLEGFELCEPCASLGAKLSMATVTAAAVVANFAHSAGIRARVIEGGSIAVGDTLESGSS